LKGFEEEFATATLADRPLKDHVFAAVSGGPGANYEEKLKVCWDLFCGRELERLGAVELGRPMVVTLGPSLGALGTTDCLHFGTASQRRSFALQRCLVASEHQGARHQDTAFLLHDDGSGRRTGMEPAARVLL
jgi:hypothetical protein